MSTYSQIHRNPRKPKHPVSSRKSRLWNRPQIAGTCVRVTIAKPKKPNSALRKVARVKCSNGQMVTVYIRGEGHSLQEHSRVLIHGQPRNDLPGVSRAVIRGAGDDGGVKNRKRARSIYGAKRPK